MSKLTGHRRELIIPFLVILLLLPVLAVRAQTIVDVDIPGFSFSPANISVEIGTTVRWTNNHTIVHTSTSDDGVWDSGNINPGNNYSFTFLATGVYPYHCIYHSLTMTGTVTVISTGAATDISIGNFVFEPADITVEPGTVVTWTNNNDIIHTTTSDAGVWDSGNLNPGETFSYLFNVLGDFPYHCTPHPFMTGNVTVMIPPSCTCGEVNGDDMINILDIVYLINFKYKGGPAPTFPECSDVNNDGDLNILDIVYLINFKYKAGPAPNCGF